jgi:ubiquinone/menaquinone biosynthesis C-methylase UbiE
MKVCVSKNRMDKDRNAREYNEFAKTVFAPVYPVIAARILKKCNINKGFCLDVGSGPAHLAIALASFSDLTVYALDNARPMIAIAQENIDGYNLEKRVKPIFGDVSDLPFDDESIDLVVSRSSFFFWQNLPRGFSECLRVLKPGGMASIGWGFGDATLKKEIVSTMRTRDPDWDRSVREGMIRCNPHIVRSSLVAAGIFEYELVNDNSGYWVFFWKGDPGLDLE